MSQEPSDRNSKEALSEMIENVSFSIVWLVLLLISIHVVFLIGNISRFLTELIGFKQTFSSVSDSPIISYLIVIACSLLIFPIFYHQHLQEIPHGYQAVLLQFDRFYKVLKQDTLTIPFIERVVFKVKINQQTLIYQQNAKTLDGKDVSFEARLVWRVSDLSKAYYEYREVESMREEIQKFLIADMRSRIAGMVLSDILSQVNGEFFQDILRDRDLAFNGIEIVEVRFPRVYQISNNSPPVPPPQSKSRHVQNAEEIAQVAKMIHEEPLSNEVKDELLYRLVRTHYP